MGVFAKKGKAAEEEDVKRASQELNQQHEKKDNDSKACYSHLEAQFLMKSHGVVLKLYIENFKRMNDLFGARRGTNHGPLLAKSFVKTKCVE